MNDCVNCGDPIKSQEDDYSYILGETERLAMNLSSGRRYIHLHKKCVDLWKKRIINALFFTEIPV